MKNFDNYYKDYLVSIRDRSRKMKKFNLSDKIRDYLDSHLIFCFDTKDFQNVYYLVDNSFKHMDKEGFTNKRKYVEFLIKKDIKLDKIIDAWVYTQLKNKRK